MHHPSRPPNRPDGPTAITTGKQGSGGEDPPPHAVAAGALTQTSRSDNDDERGFGPRESTGGREPDSPSWSRSPFESRGAGTVFRTRHHLPRRASSGYFSSEGDSQPTSPLSPRPVMTDRATQTLSPTGQVVKHALQRMSEAHARVLGTCQQYGHSPSPSSTRPRNTAGDMQAEAIGRELRRIGDDFNRLLLRGVADRHRRHVIHVNALPVIHQEPTMLLCVGLLLLLIGRMIYLQGSPSSHDPSQV